MSKLSGVMEQEYSKLRNALKEIGHDVNMHLFENGPNALVIWAIMKGRNPVAVFDGETVEATIRAREFVGYLRQAYLG